MHRRKPEKQGGINMVNKVILVGNLGADVDMSYTQSGTAKAAMRVATTEKWTDKEGKKQEKTEWHRVIAWGRLAEICGEYLAKGRQAYFEGKLQTREWVDKDDNKKWTTEVVAFSMQMLGGKASAAGGAPERASTPEPDDDIPF
jgi:single-strand DNA-binding protein